MAASGSRLTMINRLRTAPAGSNNSLGRITPYPRLCVAGR